MSRMTVAWRAGTSHGAFVSKHRIPGHPLDPADPARSESKGHNSPLVIIFRKRQGSNRGSRVRGGLPFHPLSWKRLADLSVVCAYRDEKPVP